MDVFIYALIDPRTNEIRYVGKAIDVSYRVKQHCRDKSVSHKSNWISALRSQGLKPEVEILESIFNSDDLDWQQSERWWISYLKGIGCPLTNLDSGGHRGKKHSHETKIKIGAANRGSVAISEASKSRIISSETRAKLRLLHTGAKRSLETRDKNRIAHLGRKHSAETKIKCRAAGLKRKPWTLKQRGEIAERTRLQHAARKSLLIPNTVLQ